MTHCKCSQSAFYIDITPYDELQNALQVQTAAASPSTPAAVTQVGVSLNPSGDTHLVMASTQGYSDGIVLHVV